ncbi:MAG: NADH-quinone oxidoreductase subunit L, partial [Gammaproteobacteria bacterium]
MRGVYLGVVLAPLIGALIAGVFGQRIGRVWSHRVAIGSVALAFFLSLLGFKDIVIDGEPAFNQAVYTWLSSDGLNFHVGFLIDKLSVTMMVVVSFVSWMIHIYTIGYMHDDPGY